MRLKQLFFSPYTYTSLSLTKFPIYILLSANNKDHCCGIFTLRLSMFCYMHISFVSCLHLSSVLKLAFVITINRSFFVLMFFLLCYNNIFVAVFQLQDQTNTFHFLPGYTLLYCVSLVCTPFFSVQYLLWLSCTGS